MKLQNECSKRALQQRIRRICNVAEVAQIECRRRIRENALFRQVCYIGDALRTYTEDTDSNANPVTISRT